MTTQEAAPYKLGPYQLLSQIGQSRTLKIYVARRMADRQLVALRAITHPRAADPNFQQSFLEAMQAAGQLEHPNLVPVLDAAIYEDYPCVITPHFPRGPLSGWLKHNAPLDAPSTVNI